MLQRPSGGTIVTVASVLGDLGAAQLSDYTAAKAGLMAMHASLIAEVDALAASTNPPPGAKNIRFVLVKPGQLSTALFAGVKTPSSFLGPVVEPLELARRTVEIVNRGGGGVVAEPLYARYVEWFGVLPYGVQKLVRRLSGVDAAMLGFRRRAT